MRKINEIFYTIQGEGHNTGRAAVFVRFSGCNLKCPFCDTAHEDGVPMTDEEILAKVCKYPAEMVVLTGGEPSLWIDQAFVDKLHEAGKYVSIETNGTHPLPDGIDWITCSPKSGAPVRIGRMDEVKVVYVGQPVEPYEALVSRYYYLQPCSCTNTAEVVAYVQAHPLWRLSLQTHKLIGLR